MAGRSERKQDDDAIALVCFKDKPVYSGFDNTFTRFDDEGACYEIEVDGGALPPLQIGPQPLFTTSGGVSAWTKQIRWMSDQIAIRAAIYGYEWIGEVLFVNNGNPTDLSGIDDIDGAPNVEIAQAYIDADLSWRIFQITVCPGSPSPTAWRRTKGGSIYEGSTLEKRELLITRPLPGPVREFQVCAFHDGKTAQEQFYIVEQPGRKLRLLDPDTNANEMPRCLVPCGAASQIPPPSQPTTLFESQLACDEGNQIGTDANGAPVYQEFTVYWTFSNGVISGPFGTVPNPVDSTADDYEIRGRVIDCDTGDPIATPPLPCEDFTITTLWTIENKTPGLRNREWADLGPAFPFTSDPSGPEDYIDAFDDTQPPTTDTIVTANTFALNDTDNTPSRIDYQRRWGWICLDKPQEIEFGTNSEGYIGFWIGICDGELTRVISYAKPVGLERTPRYTIPAGIHRIRLDNLDWGGTNSNWTLYRVDGETATADNDLFDDMTSTTLPYERCKQVKVCKDTGAFLDLLTGAVIDPANCRPCALPPCPQLTPKPPCRCVETGELIAPDYVAIEDYAAIIAGTGITVDQGCGRSAKITVTLDRSDAPNARLEVIDRTTVIQDVPALGVRPNNGVVRVRYESTVPIDWRIALANLAGTSNGREYVVFETPPSARPNAGTYETIPEGDAWHNDNSTAVTAFEWLDTTTVELSFVTTNTNVSAHTIEYRGVPELERVCRDVSGGCKCCDAAATTLPQTLRLVP